MGGKQTEKKVRVGPLQFELHDRTPPGPRCVARRSVHVCVDIVGVYKDLAVLKMREGGREGGREEGEEISLEPTYHKIHPHSFHHTPSHTHVLLVLQTFVASDFPRRLTSSNHLLSPLAS